jgi:hypothetical protein
VLQPDVAGEVKLNGLLGLYTSCPTKPTQYLVLLQLLKFAQQSKQLAALLVPVIKVSSSSLQQQEQEQELQPAVQRLSSMLRTVWLGLCPHHSICTHTGSRPAAE